MAFIESAECLGLRVEEFDSFEFDQAPAGLNPTALQQAQNLDSGALSPMVTSPDQTGIFVYVSEKVVPEVNASDEDFVQAETRLKQWSKYLSGRALSSELIESGLDPQ